MHSLAHFSCRHQSAANLNNLLIRGAPQNKKSSSNTQLQPQFVQSTRLGLVCYLRDDLPKQTFRLTIENRGVVVGSPYGHCPSEAAQSEPFQVRLFRGGHLRQSCCRNGKVGRVPGHCRPPGHYFRMGQSHMQRRRVREDRAGVLHVPGHGPAQLRGRGRPRQPVPRHVPHCLQLRRDDTAML